MALGGEGNADGAPRRDAVLIGAAGRELDRGEAAAARAPGRYHQRPKKGVETTRQDGHDGRGASGERLTAAVGWFRARLWASVGLGLALELAAALAFRHTDAEAAFGVPGAVGIAIAVAVAIVQGTAAGVAVGAVGGVLFATIVADGAWAGGLVLVLVWGASAGLAGLAGARARRRTARALAELETARSEAQALSDSFERILASAPAFLDEGSFGDVAQTVCTAAINTFRCDAASLWLARDGAIRLVSRVPALATLVPGETFRLADFPELSAALDDRRVSFIADVEGGSSPGGEMERAARLGSRSLLRVPLDVDDDGTVLAIGWQSATAPPSRATLLIAQRFADQAAVALEQARVREAQREASRLHHRLETGLLPTLEVRDEAVTIATRYQAGEDRLLLGGDFYDAVELRDGALALLVGDVSGHGPDAAALGANLRAAWRALVLSGSDAAGLLSTLQAVLERERATPETFVTCCCVWIEADRAVATVALAGHPAPLLLASGPRVVEVPAGPPLGMLAKAQWTASQLELPPRAALLLYTDGLVEGRAAPDSRERLGVERLLRLVEEIDPEGHLLDGGLDRLLQRVKVANGNRFGDDVALLLASF